LVVEAEGAAAAVDATEDEGGLCEPLLLVLLLLDLLNISVVNFMLQVFLSDGRKSKGGK